MTPGPGTYEPDQSASLTTHRVTGYQFGQSRSPAHALPVQPATELPKEEMVARSPPKGVDFSRHTAPRLFEGMKPTHEPASAADQVLYSSFKDGSLTDIHKPTSSFSLMRSPKIENVVKSNTPGPGSYEVLAVDLQKVREPRATGVAFGKQRAAQHPLPYRSGESDAPPSDSNPLTIKASADKAKSGPKSSWAVSGTGDRQSAFKTSWLATKEAPIMYADPDILKHEVQKLGAKSSNKTFLTSSPRFDDNAVQPNRFG